MQGSERRSGVLAPACVHVCVLASGLPTSGLPPQPGEERSPSAACSQAGPPGRQAHLLAAELFEQAGVEWELVEAPVGRGVGQQRELVGAARRQHHIPECIEGVGVGAGRWAVGRGVQARCGQLRRGWVGGMQHAPALRCRAAGHRAAGQGTYPASTYPATTRVPRRPQTACSTRCQPAHAASPAQPRHPQSKPNFTPNQPPNPPANLLQHVLPARGVLLNGWRVVDRAARGWQSGWAKGWGGVG